MLSFFFFDAIDGLDDDDAPCFVRQALSSVLSLSPKERRSGGDERRGCSWRTLSTHSMPGPKEAKTRRGFVAAAAAQAKREKRCSNRFLSSRFLQTLHCRSRTKANKKHGRRPRAPRGRLARRGRRRPARREGRICREPARPHAGPLRVRKRERERWRRERISRPQPIERRRRRRRPFFSLSLSLFLTSTSPTTTTTTTKIQPLPRRPLLQRRQGLDGPPAPPPSRGGAKAKATTEQQRSRRRRRRRRRRGFGRQRRRRPRRRPLLHL